MTWYITPVNGNTVTEGGTLTFQISRNHYGNETVQINTFQGVYGSNNVNDYSVNGQGGAQTFSYYDQAPRYITVNANQDGVSDGSEFFQVAVKAADYSFIPGYHAAAAFEIRDAIVVTPPQITISADQTYNEANNGYVNLTISLDKAPTSQVTVQWYTATGSASEGAGDYDGRSPQTLTWNPGAPLSQTISVRVWDEAYKQEGNEYFYVNLQNASGATLGDNSARIDILDHYVAPVVTPTINISADQSYSEANNGYVYFTVSLDKVPTSQVSVQWFTSAAGTATSTNGDYLGINPTPLTWNAGDGNPKTIAVKINDEPTKQEGTESFQIQLQSASGATINRGAATVTIIDNYVAPVTPPTISISSDQTYSEANNGYVYFTVSLDKTPTSPVSVQWFTAADGTATSAQGDYAGVNPTTLTWNAGDSSSRTIQIKINDEPTKNEGPEYFQIKLQSATGSDHGTKLC